MNNTLAIERDPYVNGRLERAVRQVAREAEGYSRPWPVHSEGPGPRTLNQLAGMAKQLGYTMKLSDLHSTARRLESHLGAPSGTLTINGATMGAIPAHMREPDDEPLTIRVERTLEPAERVRVAAHEVGHAFLGHVSTSEVEQEKMAQAISFLHSLTGEFEIPSQEAAVELGAAAFCRVNGFDSAVKSPNYIASKLHGAQVPESVIQDGIRLAIALNKAVR